MIELQTGMKIMGILNVIAAIFAIFLPLSLLLAAAGMILDGLVLCAIGLFAIYAGILWLKWL